MAITYPNCPKIVRQLITKIYHQMKSNNNTEENKEIDKHEKLREMKMLKLIKQTLKYSLAKGYFFDKEDSISRFNTLIKSIG